MELNIVLQNAYIMENSILKQTFAIFLNGCKQKEQVSRSFLFFSDKDIEFTINIFYAYVWHFIWLPDLLIMHIGVLAPKFLGGQPIFCPTANILPDSHPTPPLLLNVNWVNLTYTCFKVQCFKNALLCTHSHTKK